MFVFLFFFFQAEDGIRDVAVTGVQTCALPILERVCAGEVGQPKERDAPEFDRALEHKEKSDQVRHGQEEREAAAHRVEALLTIQLEHLALEDRKSTRLNSSHGYISYAVFCLKKKNQYKNTMLS